MALPMDLGSFGKALLAGDNSAVQSQLSKIGSKLSTHRRAKRNALYRKAKRMHAMTPEAKKYFDTNPECFGLPRSFLMEFVDVLPGRDASSINGARVTFGQFGCDTGGITIDDHIIAPDDIDYCEATQSYRINGLARNKKAGDDSKAISAHFEFISTEPTGTIIVNGSMYNVKLKSSPVMFNASVSHNAGAKWDSGGEKLSWEPDSPQWANATWEHTLDFGYEVITEFEDILGFQTFLENHFHDKISSPVTPFELRQWDYHTIYTSIMDGQADESGSLLITNVSDPSAIPDVPVERLNGNVKSVFPVLTNFLIDHYGMGFTGAYQVEGEGTELGAVYAVKGDVVWDPKGVLSALCNPKADLPVVDLLKGMTPGKALGSPQDKEGKAAAPLQITGLLGLKVMVPDPNDPSGYRDSVAQQTMEDFHKIIVHYMDTDIRETFVMAAPMQLDADVKAIAEDDIESSREFYKKLQVPYVCEFLAKNTTIPEAKNVNGARAGKRLKQIPVDNPVYERHMTKLYRLRFLQKFPQVKAFLDDQANVDRNADIQRIADKMKDALRRDTASAGMSNPTYAADLARSLQEIDDLTYWAKTKKLYWAFTLLYYVQTNNMKNWFGQYTNGRLPASLGMTIKEYNTTFGILEDNQVNTGGANFMQTFNGMMETFQMTSLIPQLIDMQGNATEFDSLLQPALYAFYNHWKVSDDAEMRDLAEAAKRLHDERLIRLQFYESFVVLKPLGTAAAAWTSIAETWTSSVSNAAWFKALAWGQRGLKVMTAFLPAAMMFMPIMFGGVENMSTDIIISWAGSIASVGSMLIMKIAQGAIRLANVWKDIAGLGPSLKVFFNTGTAYKNAVALASKGIGNAFANFFVGVGGEVVEVTTSSTARFIKKLFSKSFGKVLGSVIGMVLSIATLVTTSIRLATQQDPMLIAVDVMMIISASITILGIAAGWLVSAGAGAAAGTALATMMPALTMVSTWAGPVGIAFAVIGIIIFFVWFSMQDTQNPVQKFISNHVKPAGLYMDHLAIDYFVDIPATSSAASLVGVSISVKLDGNKRAYIKLDDNNAPVTTSQLQYSHKDIWSLSTDGFGKSYISTQAQSPAQSSTQSSADRPFQTYFLALNDGKNALIARTMPPKSDVAAYNAALPSVQWSVSVLAPPDTAAGGSQVLSASCGISQGSNELSLNNTSAGQASVLSVSGGTYKIWTLEMQPMGPGTFVYSKNPWRLTKGELNELNHPRFTPSTVSRGFTWSADPPLPNVFELVPKGGTDEGLIKMKKNVPLSTLQSGTTSYIVKCFMTHNGTQVERTTVLSIEISG